MPQGVTQPGDAATRWLTGLAVIVGLAWLWPFLALRHAPSDGARAERMRQHVASPALEAGPVEAALHRLARERGREALLIETEEPTHDLRLRARACDRADAASCTRVAVLFVHFLGDPTLGLRLWLDACDAGIATACTRAAERIGSDYAQEYDRRRARDLYRRGCTPDALDASGCLLAAEPDRIARFDWGPREVSEFDPRPDLRFLYLDRGCELGDERACQAVWGDFRDRQGEAAAQILAYYDSLRRATTFRSPRKIWETRLERIASGSPGALEHGRQDEVTSWKRSHHAALERQVVRERAADALTMDLLQQPEPPRFFSFRALRGSIEVKPEGSVCLSRCPSPGESPDRAAAEACLCGCLLETLATNIPEAILVRCRDRKPLVRIRGW